VGLFAQLPLAALVESSTLIMHGGLFRTPPKTGQPVRNLGLLPADVELPTGSLEDLRRAGKGGVDPDPDSKYGCQRLSSTLPPTEPCAMRAASGGMQANAAVVGLLRSVAEGCMTDQLRLNIALSSRVHDTAHCVRRGVVRSKLPAWPAPKCAAWSRHQVWA